VRSEAVVGRSDSVAMEPLLTAFFVGMLMCFSSICYYFRIPEDLAKKSGRAGRWGPPNAEFNWCEADYELTEWVAEPLNTGSCIALIVPPLMFWAMHTNVEPDVGLLVLTQVFIGIGSVFFHATLRYTMQLLDEVPMLWYSQFLVAALVWRMYKFDVYALAGVWCSSLTALIFLTEQHSTIHEILRGAMTLSFVVGLVFTGYGFYSLNSEWTDKHPTASIAYVRMTLINFAAFVLSVMCWLVDNYFCPALQALPLGLPYPQLHMCWHVLIAYCCLCLLSGLQFYDQSLKEQGREHLRFVFRWGMPLVVS